MWLNEYQSRKRKSVFTKSLKLKSSIFPIGRMHREKGGYQTGKIIIFNRGDLKFGLVWILNGQKEVGLNYTSVKTTPILQR